MRRHFDTRQVADRHRRDYWHDAVCSTYFPLALNLDDDDPLGGQLLAWEFAGRNVSLSCLASPPAVYARSAAHIASSEEPSWLLTMPCGSAIHFEQDGQRVECEPGHFIVERSDLPYRFAYAAANRIMVLKVPETLVRERLGHGLDLAGLAFDCRTGLGRMFFEQVRALHDELDQLELPAQSLLLDQLLDSFCLIILNDPRVLSSEGSAMAAFHLANIERFIMAHLAEADLTPERIAQGCGISPRYLYKLLGGRDTSPTRLVYEKRLLAVYRQLADSRVKLPIAELAYAHGFNDPAHFSRSFRTRFGASPSEVRRRGC